MKKRLLFITVLLLFIASNASALMFDPTGTGSTTNAVIFDVLDWAPSSAVAVNANGAGVDDTFTLYTAGRLTELSNSGSTVWAPTFGSQELTFIAGFSEKVTSSSFNLSTGESKQAFQLSATQPNFFQVYLDNIPDYDGNLSSNSDSAGTGYGDGILLMSGTVTGGSGNFSSNFYKDIVLLDQTTNGDQASGNANFGGDNPQKTVTGTGGTTIISQVDFSNFNPNYFPEIDPNQILSMIFNTNTNNNIPFVQSDPFNTYNMGNGSYTNWNTNGDATFYNVNVGGVNGLPNNFYGLGGINGPDVLFQMDASTSVVGAIPEPATLILFGLGLLGFAGFARKK